MKRQLFKITDTDTKELVEECDVRLHIQSFLSRNLLEATNQLGLEGVIDILDKVLPVQTFRTLS